MCIVLYVGQYSRLLAVGRDRRGIKRKGQFLFCKDGIGLGSEDGGGVEGEADMSYFSNSEINLLRRQYEALEPRGSNMASREELHTIAKRVGVHTSELDGYLGTQGIEDQDLVSFEDFIDAAAKIKEKKGSIHVNEGDRKIRHHGYKEDTMHTIDEDERISFTLHVNNVLAEDPLIKPKLPIDPQSEDLISACKDGIILAKLINHTSPGMIDERVLNTTEPLSAFQIVENLNLVINTAKTLEISVVNIGAEDVIEGRAHLIFGLIWQVIKLRLKQNVALTKHPELYRLLKEDEPIESFMKEPPEASVIRWVNYHLQEYDCKPIANLSSDLKDGKVYTLLLNKLDPEYCDLAPLEYEDPKQRASEVLKHSERLGCSQLFTPASIVNANPKLNFAFLAELLDKRTGLESLDTEQLAELDAKLFAFGEHIDGEAKHFLLWINSTLGSSKYLHALDDLNDGVVLLKLFDKVYPGIVDWKKKVNVPNPTLSRFQKLENTNYVVQLSKSVNFSLVGIQGADITENSPIAIKSIVWQLMRASMLKTLASLSDGGTNITEADVVGWAVDVVKKNCGTTTISSCRDPSIKTGIFLIELLDALKPNTVNKSLVTKGQTQEDAKLNAQYAISIARKIGATIFTLPEDITGVKSKMIFIFIGVLMAIAKRRAAAKTARDGE